MRSVSGNDFPFVFRFEMEHTVHEHRHAQKEIATGTTKYFGATLDELVAEGASAMQPIRPEFKLGNDCRFLGDFFGDSTTNDTVRRRSFTGWRGLPYDPVSNLWWSLSNRPCEKFPRRSWNLIIMANKCWFKCPVFFLLLISTFVAVSISGNFVNPIAIILT